jgi:DNA-binding MarR family transcriptional regulator
MQDESSNLVVQKIVENVFSIFPLISKELTRDLRANNNISPGVLFLLKLLNNHELLTMSEIGCKMTIPKPHATVLVDKLVSENWAERVYDPKDRRIVNIRLTEDGRSFFLVTKKSIGEEMRRRIRSLDGDAMNRMLEASQLVRETLTTIMDRVELSECCVKNKV